MLNTTPPARYDLPWKIAIAHAFRDFMDFFFPALAAQIDWSKRPRFHDKELAGAGLDGIPNFMVADKLVEVCLRNGPAPRVLIHVEVQAQRDPHLAQRVLDYNYRISCEYKLPVTSIVLLADDDPTWYPHGSHNELMGWVIDISFATAKLLDYVGRTEELEVSGNPIAWVSVAHIRTQQAHHDAKKLYAAKLQLTRLLFQHDWSKRRIIVLFNVVNWMMVLPASYQRRFWRAAVQLKGGQKMRLLNPLEQMFFDDGWKKGRRDGLEEGRGLGQEKSREKGLREGLKEGLKEGRVLGRKDGAAALLERLLVRRFGPLPKAIHNKLAKASMAQLEEWSDALPGAQSLRQIFGPKVH